MLLYENEISTLGLFFTIVGLIGQVIINIVASNNPASIASDIEKTSAYECGFEPYEDSLNTFDIRFYLVAILFIIFDLESVYFFPWSVSFSYLNLNSFWGMFDFVIELFVGYVYAYEAGAMDWD